MARPEPGSARVGPLTRSVTRHALGVLLLVGAVALSAAARIHYTLQDPNFAGRSAAALLYTDPAFIYYVTERVVEGGGLPPEDFRADPRVEYPETSDLPAMFTVGQEFFVAWTYRWFGGGLPLHVFAVWAMSLFASLTAVGVFGLAFELTQKVRWAAVAAWIWALMLGNHRTMGFVLIREDFALPWFALHLCLVARSARVRSVPSYAFAGASLVAAAATWHAMSFVLLMEAACFLLWFLRTGRNPLGGRHAWVLVATAAVLSLLVPVLRAKLFLLSPAAWIGLSLAATGLAAGRFALGRAGQTAAVLGVMGALAALSRVIGAPGDYAHVYELLVAKLLNLGVLPADPTELSFGARLLWQGPFATADPQTFLLGLTAGCAALAVALLVDLPGWLTGRGDPPRMLLLCFGVSAAVATWIVVRAAPILGLVTPVIAALLLARLARVGRAGAGLAAALACLALVGHGVFGHRVLEHWENAWYAPSVRGEEREGLMNWIRRRVPEGQPVVADFLNSASILAHTGRPVVQQPKYETRRSRDRIQQFFETFFLGTPQDLERYVKRLGSHVLVVDRPWLGGNCAIAGVTQEQVAAHPERAAWAFLSNDPRVYGQVSGFRLVYQSPAERGFNPYRVYIVD